MGNIADELPGSSSSGAPSGNGANQSGGSDGTGANLERLVNEAINKALGPRLARIMEKVETLASPQAVQQQMDAYLAKLTSGPPDMSSEHQGAANGGSAERPTLKGLEQRYEQRYNDLQRRFEAAEKARADAEQRIKDARLRSEVDAQFRQLLGSDSPHIGPLLDSYLDVRKRFALDDEGNPVVRFKRDWGEEALPLEQGFKELAESELKHYTPAKSARLPSSRVPIMVAPTRPGEAQQGQARDLFAETMAQGLAANGQTAIAGALMDSVSRSDK